MQPIRIQRAGRTLGVSYEALRRIEQAHAACKAAWEEKGLGVITFEDGSTMRVPYLAPLGDPRDDFGEGWSEDWYDDEDDD